MDASIVTLDDAMALHHVASMSFHKQVCTIVCLQLDGTKLFKTRRGKGLYHTACPIAEPKIRTCRSSSRRPFYSLSPNKLCMAECSFSLQM